ncbi:MAG TPA: hypothetical protein VGN82_13655 [Bosea sp. (in: a-proteobacteria)]|jgi:hypothetical protein|uniref:hypothetical protein n=1 Tax=Bosea sp. (in: a-proteobacteria) TaxID=1871050 RepID=UPI002E107CF3|nr:hypothetical protein [Bosea sp. (in: a-proteobacteria)]
MSYNWRDATVVIEHKGFKITDGYVGFGLRTADDDQLLFKMKSADLKRMALSLLLTAGTAAAVEATSENFARVEADILVDRVRASVNDTLEFGVLSFGGGELGAGSLSMPISDEAIRSLIRVLPKILQAIAPPHTA